MAKTPISGYRTYNFVDGKDPRIDQVRTLLQDNGMSYKDVELNGGPKAGTLYNWFHKDVRRPQNCSIAACVRAVPGHDYGIIFPKDKQSVRKKNRDKFSRARRNKE